MITFTGDVKLVINNDGDLDINIQNGQPEMTDFIDTLVNLYVFGEDSAYNGTVQNESEKMKSKFPEFLKTANVSDSTISEGITYLTECLEPLIIQKIAKSINVDGNVFSVYGIQWIINIERFDNGQSKYSIAWEKGFISLEGSQNGTN